MQISIFLNYDNNESFKTIELNTLNVDIYNKVNILKIKSKEFLFKFTNITGGVIPEKSWDIGFVKSGIEKLVVFI